MQTSPFQTDQQNNSTSSTPSNNELSLRTLKDDLEALKTKGLEKTQEQKESTETSTRPSVANEPIPSGPTDYAKNPSPFFSQQISSTKEMPRPLAANPAQEKPLPKAIEKEKTSTLIEIPTEIKNDSEKSSFKILGAVIVILTISILSLGGYYFWMTKTPAAPMEASPIEQPVEDVPVIIESPTEKYSTTKPNYLTLDLTAGVEETKKSISAIAMELKEVAPSTAYEFLIVDKENNPVEFPVFATSLNLAFSQNIISSLEKDFSFFIYNDSGNMRTGFSVSMKDKNNLSKLMLIQEKTLVTDLTPLFLDSKPEQLAVYAFKDNSHSSYATRYLNLNIQEKLSIDYALTEKKLVLGTSMEMMRAIIDKQKNITSSPEAIRPTTEEQATEEIPIPSSEISPLTDTATE